MDKTILTSASIFLLCICFLSCSEGTSAESPRTIPLKDGWTLCSSADTTVSYNASVPCTVMGAIERDSSCAGLFMGTNYSRADRKPFEVPWIYRTSFKLPDTGGRHVFLNFDGISYRADIRLNGKLIASKDSVYGPFRRFSFDVTGVAGRSNDLTVEVWKAGKGEPNIGFVDWSPKPLDDNMGLFRGVNVKLCGDVLMRHTGVRSKVDTSTLKAAGLFVSTELKNLTGKEIKGKLKGRIKSEGIEFALPVALAAGVDTTLEISPEQVKALKIKNPRLWWTWDLGSPELYDIELKFVTDGGEVTDCESATFGIRQIDSYFTPEGHRGFLLNGRKILVKGAGWADDIFLRDTPTSNERQIRYVKDMNLNAIRCEGFWGNDGSLYDICDRYGILVLVGWSCQWEWNDYISGDPKDPDYGCISDSLRVHLLAKSFADQTFWLRNHPSIAAWYTGSDRRPARALDSLYKSFLDGCHNDRPVVCSAKGLSSKYFGPAGMKMNGPYEYVGPSYWYEDTSCGGAFGFNTETGPGAQLPVRESIERMIPHDSLWPVLNSDYAFHCSKAAAGMNDLKFITSIADAKFGSSSSLDDYLRKAYLLSYESTKSMFEAFRVNKANATGIIQWMLNGAWPKLYWQLYDYYGVPTSAYYGVKKANEPIQLVYDYKDNSAYSVRDSYGPQENLSVLVEEYAPDGYLVLRDEEDDVEVGSFCSVKACTIDTIAPNAIIFLSLYRGKQEISFNSYLLSQETDIYDFDHSDWFYTPIRRYADFKALSSMPRADLKVISRKSSGSRYAVEVSNLSDVPAFFIELKLKDKDGNIVVPAFWSDNYLSIPPKGTRKLELDPGKDGFNASGCTISASAWNSDTEKTELK